MLNIFLCACWIFFLSRKSLPYRKLGNLAGKILLEWFPRQLPGGLETTQDLWAWTLIWLSDPWLTMAVWATGLAGPVQWSWCEYLCTRDVYTQKFLWSFHLSLRTTHWAEPVRNQALGQETAMPASHTTSPTHILGFLFYFGGFSYWMHWKNNHLKWVCWNLLFSNRLCRDYRFCCCCS